jgi:hypothetical protein
MKYFDYVFKVVIIIIAICFLFFYHNNNRYTFDWSNDDTRISILDTRTGYLYFSTDYPYYYEWEKREPLKKAITP